MVSEDRHQCMRGESHLVEPGEKPTHLLICVGNLAGVWVAGVCLLVRFRGIVRSMWIEIVSPQEKFLLPILLEPLERALCDLCRAALGENTGEVVLFGLVTHAV